MTLTVEKATVVLPLTDEFWEDLEGMRLVMERAMESDQARQQGIYICWWCDERFPIPEWPSHYRTRRHRENKRAAR